VDGICTLGGLTWGRFDEGNEGRVAFGGFIGRFAFGGTAGRVDGRCALGILPKPPREGREPPSEGIPPAPPEFGIDGREFTFPNEGRDGLGRDMFGVLGLLGILGRELGIVGRDMFDILGRAPPPPICPIEGLAPPPPIDGLAPPPPPIDGLPPPPPPPPPLPRWARASGTHMTPNNRVAIIADFTRMFFFASIILILIALSVYFAAVGGFLTTVT
jgi:hypothetical protein